MNNIQNQTKALNLFHRQQSKNRVSHAYLIVGDYGTLDYAKYMVMSMMCGEQDIGACGSCSTCQRIDSENHADFRILSGKEQSIKKSEIISLKEYFSQSSIETAGHQVYIIEDVDNATVEAMNSLLKFLEEPEGDIVAILTTRNENRVLETIRSRCLTVHLESMNHQVLFDKAHEQGIDDVDAYLLSRMNHNFEELELQSSTEVYKEASSIFFDVLECLNQRDYLSAILTLQVEGIKKKRLDRERLLLLFELLELSFSSQGQQEQTIHLRTNAITNVDRIHLLQIVLSLKDRIRPGVNINLVIDQFGYELTKYYKNL
ncbi:DNA polymerase III subunit [Erysipelothrix rhusiopathiae]|nr:DNA polymerase III subunit [Erysipelothrix rhusiopathiae]MDE8173226.1 DNA polymerase III subunit [Erysipelothrix rhusiopathiae]MDE8181988.1 DNA polymerase III subunit [Erysipelothrix rhusiopathiae]MDE9423072.1 DNA polymerase III subunit [Erysipelothrix rhusiopathiae]